MKKSLLLSVVLLACSTFFADAEEGMYPISEIGRLNLKAKGLEIDPSDIYDPNKISLIDGICRVNGCTGSFVSPNGLIITNHHCAYRAIQSASSPDKDYLKDGFQAKTQTAEIPAKGYTVRITESYRDVSKDVLSVVKPTMSSADRTKAISKRRKELEQAAEAKNPGKRAEVAEMFTGKTYVLFLYTYIRDVRLVFAPPSSVGNFGGDVDNWEWPRHTGDFSLMRAYVAPDGSTATYAKENVPYKPKRHIKVSSRGVDEEDFVFLLGYPGRTSRHKTAAFLEYEKNVRLPYIVDLYQWQIREMEATGANNRAVALKHSSRSRSLANVEKRSRGQLKGLARKQLVEARMAQEAKLQKFIESDSDRKQKYGSLLDDIAGVYAEMAQAAPYENDVANLVNACRSLNFAFTIYDAAVERQRPDIDRESRYMDRNIDQTVRRMMLAQRDLHVPTDKRMLHGMLKRLANHKEEIKNVAFLKQLNSDAFAVDQVIDRLFNNSKMHDEDAVKKFLQMTPKQLAASDDAMIKIVVQLYPEYKRLREKNKEREGKLGQLYGSLIEVKAEFMRTDFVPDANATLRMTFGRVRRYSPEDGVIKTPITTLKGVIDKTTGKEPFVTPQKILDMYAKKDFGKFTHPKTGQVPVAILYSTDTTGGNSGSPILNAKGELVGVNFDRAFEATINDFAWNKDYSRSIGVDIRYVLWITGKVYGANHLLKEMGVE